MDYSSFARPPVDPVVVAAQTRVRVTLDRDRFVVSPADLVDRPSPAFEPFPLPRLCGRRFEEAARDDARPTAARKGRRAHDRPPGAASSAPPPPPPRR